VADRADARIETARENEGSETLTIETGELPKTKASKSAASSDSTTAWTAEDRALAAATALAAPWTDQTIQSTILAIDTATVAGNRPVLITLDGHPGEEQLINHLPDLIVARHPAWRATWRRDHMDAEQVDVPIVTHDATRVEPLAPILADESASVEAGIADSIVVNRSAPAFTPTIPVVIDDAALMAADALAPTAANDATPLSTRAELFRNTRATGATSVPQETAFVLRPRPPAALAPSDAAADRPSDPPPMHEPENGWPIGPAPLGRVAMADLMSRVVAAPTIVAGLLSEQGVTKNRLVELFAGIPRAQAKELAEILLAWFDQAGVLVEPTKPGRPRHPRALVTTNLAAIAARLNATPCPDKGTVVALWAASHEGRN